MRYLKNEPFSVAPGASKAYRDNWDAIFGPKPDDDAPFSHNCKRCGGPPATNEPMKKHDSYWCLPCNAWLESGCKAPDCEFCSTRPEHPLDVPFEQRASWGGECV